MASVNFTGFVFKHDVRNYSRVNRCRQMRTEADANVERCVEMERDRWAELVHRLALQADEDRERVAAFFNSYAPGMDTREQAGETILEILHHRAGIGTEGEMDHAGAVLAHHLGDIGKFEPQVARSLKSLGAAALRRLPRPVLDEALDAMDVRRAAPLRRLRRRPAAAKETAAP